MSEEMREVMRLRRLQWIDSQRSQGETSADDVPDLAATTDDTTQPSNVELISQPVQTENVKEFRSQASQTEVLPANINMFVLPLGVASRDALLHLAGALTSLAGSEQQVLPLGSDTAASHIGTASETTSTVNTATPALKNPPTKHEIIVKKCPENTFIISSDDENTDIVKKDVSVAGPSRKRIALQQDESSDEHSFDFDMMLPASKKCTSKLRAQVLSSSDSDNELSEMSSFLSKGKVAPFTRSGTRKANLEGQFQSRLIDGAAMTNLHTTPKLPWASAIHSSHTPRATTPAAATVTVSRSTPQEETEDDPHRGMCQVCLAHRPNRLIQCGHAFCEDCFTKVKSMKKGCPLCGYSFRKWNPIYL